MWAGAVHDEDRVARVAAQRPFDQFAMGDADCAGYVAIGVEVVAAYVDEHEVLPAVAHGVVDVPAVGFESERALEMREGGGAVGRGDFGDGRGHVSLHWMWFALQVGLQPDNILATRPLRCCWRNRLLPVISRHAAFPPDR